MLFGAFLTKGQPASAATSCTSQAIETTARRVAEFHRTLWDIGSTADKMYNRLNIVFGNMPNCESSEDALDDRHRSLYAFIFLVGYCDAAYVVASRKEYAHARALLDDCLSTHDSYRPLATARHWTSYFDYEKRFMPLLRQTDRRLTGLGYPPGGATPTPSATP